MDGLLPINKPAGITSYDVIRRVKKALIRGTKIGHAGTLDPFAEGVLVLLLGKATKRFAEIQSWKKTYLATAKLGAKSDTLDKDGKITKQARYHEDGLDLSSVQQIADRYVGEIEQEIPAYAAAKYKGRKLYEYAREGKKVPKKSKKVMIYSIEVMRVDKDEVEMRVVCGSGTYIRQLSSDILQQLGIESYLEKLVREAVGEITLEQAIDVDMAVQSLLHEYDELGEQLR
jgi:tRNA pseudouridine55 synthase